MSQHDYVIDNQDGASFRGDINAALQAIVSQNSGPTEPATPYAFMLWQDTTAGVLKQRNAANTAWVAVVDAIAAAPLSRLLTAKTAQAATSGTAIDFTSIPSWAKRITVALAGVSTTGTADIIVQLGTSGGVQTSSYLGACSTGNNAIVTSSMSNGFLVGNNNSAASVMHAVVTLVNVTGNTWVMQGIGQRSDTTAYGFSSGSVMLAGLLDRIRVTTATGLPTFDLGNINIFYE